MNNPTPIFVATITTIIVTVLSLWIIATLVESARNRDLEAELNPPMCVTDTLKDVPCPKDES